MDSQIENISPVECRVKVKIPWKEVSSRLDGKMKELRRQVRIPGFRPGKVPPHMLERLYGKSVRQEVAQDIVQETFQTAVGQHEKVPLTQPVLESSAYSQGENFAYTARFEVTPSIEPKDYTGLAVRRRPAAADPDKVEELIAQKQRELTEIRPVDDDTDREETREGDIWTVDIEGTFGDDPLNHKDIRIEIGAAQEFIPGIGKALEGTKLSERGGVKEIEFLPPQDNLKEEFKGKSVKAKLALRELREKVVPELDDEFARDTGEGESMDELRANLEKQVLEEDQAEAERDARRRLVESILEKNDFDAAPSMITREVQAQVDLFKRQLAQQGMNLQMLGSSDAQMAERMRPQSTFNVKAFLLLDAIGKKEDIDVADEDFDAEIEEMAKEQGQNVQRLRAQLEQSNQLVLLRAQMREEKILDFLMDKAEVTEAPDPEEDEAEAAGETDTGAGDSIG